VVIDADKALRPYSQQYLDYCLAWRTVVAAYKMERHSINYEAWMMAKTPFDSGPRYDEKYAQYYCQ
jgi:hypothetical protein